ncbi:hypothetical protein ANCDUO_19624 [Ancylostoma duodenale]|uniref:Peptidase M16 C-terminal domain-containing protein n=1 Tax=Ancylostoma duodenale TaxID=51022 RepID=A0A0C2C222_9BILA|nr:hypothetical protein ANCDUO_19624 [Ancylostoma duodenale]
MNDSRWTAKILNWYPWDRRRPQGKPPRRWLDFIKVMCCPAWIQKAKIEKDGQRSWEPIIARSGESVDANFAGKQRVLGVGGSESSFIYQTCSMDCDWMSEELAATMLFAQYLSQGEGALYRAIRGGGLAYGANIYVRSELRTITLSLYRCAQPVQAYEQTKKSW